MVINFWKGLLALVMATFCQWALSAPANAPGVTDTKIVFGTTQGFEGVWGTAYKNYSAGMMAYFEDINAKGGVHGRKIEVTRLEDNYVTEKAVENIKRFGTANDVFGMVGIGGAAITLAALPLLDEFKLPTVGTFTGSEGVRDYNRYLFHTRAGYGTEVRKMVEHLHTVGISQIAVVYQDNTFGKGVLTFAVSAIEGRKGKVVASIPHPIKDWNTAQIVKQLVDSRAQAVLMFTAPGTVVDLVKGYKATTGLPMPSPWALSVVSPSKLREQLGDDARGIAVTQVMPHPSSTASLLSRNYRALMSKGGATPNMNYEAVEGYVTARVVVEALKRSGRNLSREKYLTVLEGMGDLRVDELFVKYSPKLHHGPSFVEVTLVGRSESVVR